MCTNSTKIPLHDLQVIFKVGAVGGMSDEQLLSRFVSQGETAAFEALMDRHGPMVQGICYRLLRNRHDVEDAYQASFYILARHASSLSRRDRVASWLYTTARRVALKLRAKRKKQFATERSFFGLPEPAAEAEPNDTITILNREVDQLCEKYRLPFVLCELQGKTHREAAELLGFPLGTVSSNLRRAKAQLKKRLSRQGLSIGSLALLTGDAAVPRQLVVSTARAATEFAAGRTIAAGMVSAKISALAREVLRSMLLTKISIFAVALIGGLTVVAVGTGSAYPPNPTKERVAVRSTQKADAVATAIPTEVKEASKPTEPKELFKQELQGPAGAKFSIELTSEDLKRVSLGAKLSYGDKVSLAEGELDSTQDGPKDFTLKGHAEVGRINLLGFKSVAVAEAEITIKIKDLKIIEGEAEVVVANMTSKPERAKFRFNDGKFEKID